MGTFVPRVYPHTCQKGNQTMRESMKDEILKQKKESRREMLERAKQIAQQRTTDRDLMASKASPPRSDDREPYAGIQEEQR